MNVEHFIRYTRRAALMAFLTVVVGCGGGAEDDMEGMPGMSEAGGAAAGENDAAAALRTHLERMSTLPHDSLLPALAQHRQMVANMLAQMNREMSSMNMASDVAWNSTVDSIRSDLTSMPGMTSAELAMIMPDHRTRVERLMSMHAAMMGRM